MTFKQLKAILPAYGMYMQGWFIRCAQSNITVVTLYGLQSESPEYAQVTLIQPELLCSEEQRTPLKTLGYLHDIQVSD